MTGCEIKEYLQKYVVWELPMGCDCCPIRLDMTCEVLIRLDMMIDSRINGDLEGRKTMLSV